MPAVIYIDKNGETIERGYRRKPQPTQLSHYMVQNSARWVVIEDRAANQQWGVIDANQATASKLRRGRYVQIPHTRCASFPEKDAAIMWALMQGGV